MKQECSKRRRQTRGFTLTELAIVVATILVLAAIAIPNLLRARGAANEAAAEGAIRAITMSEIAYYALYQGYAPSLKALGPPKKGESPSAEAADLIDSQLATGYKSGYRFHYEAVDLNGDGIADAYIVNASSENADNRLLASDESGRVNKTFGSAQDPIKSGSASGEAPR